MRMSQLFIPTLREVPAEAEIASHRLMLRAGLMRKLASGIYSFLPLGYITFRKIENIVREEMDRAGAQELIMSALLPAEVYKASGRWEVFGSEMFRLKDRNGRDFCLGPTHEEIFTETVRNEIRSYRALPLILYQIQTKYRDERRPRFGVMRSREFVMKDAYSFDIDKNGLDLSYKRMYEAYCRIFDRCGLDYIVVDADTGAMGGSGSQEFMVKSEIGEAEIAFCGVCGYAANVEKAECLYNEESKNGHSEGLKMLEKVETPDVKTIEDLTEFFKCSPKEFAKTLIYQADKKVVAVMIRGDRDLNETKLQNYLGCIELNMADPETVKMVTGAEVGFAGPVGLKKDVELIVDPEVMKMKNMIVGANQTGYHYKNVNAGRDFTPGCIKDMRNVVAGDLCPSCGKGLEVVRGIEVGHVFKLGTKYSESLKCVYLDEHGKEKPMVMGCYGIGINRTMAAIIEQNNDENGIIWPISVAPYHVIVVAVKADDPEQMSAAEEIYNRLQERGVEVILDDRKERAGVKFKDADLIGIPIRITVGRRIREGIVEFKLRKEKKLLECSIEGAIQNAVKIIFSK